MMTMIIPLDQVAQRIAQQEADLEVLRREYANRKTQLSELTRRKQNLQSQLHQVENQIQAVSRGSTPPVAAAKPTSAAGTPKTFTYATLPDLIVPLLREAQGQPLTTRQLTDAVMRRGFTTSSRNPYEVVKARINELVRSGILRRSPTCPGFLLAQAKLKQAALVPTSISTNKTAMALSKSTPTKAPSSSVTVPKSSRADAPKKQRSLRELLIHLLQGSKQPLGVRELAQKALTTGYHTDSKDFSHVVKVGLSKMKEVERAPEGGYRLKKR